MEVRAHTFRPADLVGGHVALDFVNTVTARNAEPVDWLDRYERALEWSALSGSFDERALDELARMSSADPPAAHRALVRLRELRETLHDVLVASIRGETAPAETSARLEALWKDAVAHARVAVAGGHARVELDVASSGLDYLRHDLALRALELLQDFPLDRTRVCDGTHCGWLFVDTSKGGRRRWCDMATCGNAAKSRRHYARARKRS
jgi:predicted RNA-binding Zn ribbon-like protein